MRAGRTRPRSREQMRREGFELGVSRPKVLFKKDDELVVEIGTLRRHIGLPTSMSSLIPSSARMDGTMLVIELRSNV